MPIPTRRRRRSALVTAAAAALLVAAPLAAGGSAQAAGDGGGSGPALRAVASVNGPRGLDMGPKGTLLVARANGTFGLVARAGANRGSFEMLGRVPRGFLAPSLDMNSRGQIFVLTTAGEPGTRGAATLYRWTARDGRTKVADIAAYQAVDVDEADLEDNPADSNPYGVAALEDGSALVADAANNDLLRVAADGTITTVARILPRTVRVPRGLGDEAPPAGTRVPSEAVPTSVTVGADGYAYVGELRGFPATPGTSQIWRVHPNARNAVCDPAHPTRGQCRRVVDDMTSIVALQAGPRGSLVVAELAKKGWLKAEMADDPTTVVGSVIVVGRDRQVRRELAAGKVPWPGDVAVDRRGRVFVSAPIFGPGAIWRLR